MQEIIGILNVVTRMPHSSSPSSQRIFTVPPDSCCRITEFQGFISAGNGPNCWLEIRKDGKSVYSHAASINSVNVSRGTQLDLWADSGSEIWLWAYGEHGATVFVSATLTGYFIERTWPR